MGRIVFLDIDDVLLTDRAHGLPANATRREAYRLTHGVGRTLFDALPVVFDPVAVAWLNRLTTLAGAQIVVHSSWRRSVGEADTLAHLSAQGVERLHPTAPCCPWKFSSYKCNDIGFWLEEAKERKEAIDDFVIVDDDALYVWPEHSRERHGGQLIQVDPTIGFSQIDYHKALDHFDVEDPLFAPVRPNRVVVRADYTSADAERLTVVLIDGVPFSYLGTGFTACPSLPEVVVPLDELQRLRDTLPGWPAEAEMPDREDWHLVARILAGDDGALAELRQLAKRRRL